MRSILEQAFDATVETDSSGAVTGWGASAESVFGWTGSEMIGHCFVDVVVLPDFEKRTSKNFATYLPPVTARW